MRERVLEAARWLSTTPQRQRPKPLMPHLQRTFGLTAAEACKAIRQSHEATAKAH